MLHSEIGKSVQRKYAVRKTKTKKKKEKKEKKENPFAKKEK